VRIVLADDSLLVREGLTRMLDQLGHDVVAQAAHPDALLAFVAHHRPDVVIIDIKMPPTYTDEGIRAAAAIRRTDAAVGVLVLSQYVVAGYAAALLEISPSHTGYLLKDSLLGRGVLADALGRVVIGATVVDPDLVARLMNRAHRADPLAKLSERERQILALLAEGRSDRGIAGALFISLNTVGTHIQRIFRKLELPDSGDDNRRVLAVLTWLDELGEKEAESHRFP
jgi:DNA-binding NarL/FixJ family response regulator